jgi:hypothetical protein
MLLIVIVLVLLIPILAIVLDSAVGRAVAGRLERRGIAAASDMTAERLAFLEGEIERLTSEMSRLEDESQFMLKLLEGRSTADALPVESGPSTGDSPSSENGE